MWWIEFLDVCMQPLLLTAVEEGLPTCAGSANGVHAFRSTQAHWLHHRLGSIQVAAHVVPHQMLQSRAHARTRRAWTMASPPAQQARPAGAAPLAPRLPGCIKGWAPIQPPVTWCLSTCCSRARAEGHPCGTHPCCGHRHMKSTCQHKNAHGPATCHNEGGIHAVLTVVLPRTIGASA